MMRRRFTPFHRSSVPVAALVGAFLFTDARAVHAQVIFSAGGASAVNIQTQVDAFRAALGPLNPNTSGSAVGGRREINWDGVPAASASPGFLPADFFNVNSPRGVVFATPGNALQVSANSSPTTPIEFGDINPNNPSYFAPFSAQRLFTSIGSNIIDVSFFVPGATTAASVTAFGAVFSDVDLPNTSSIEFFDALNASLGIFFVPSVGIAGSGNETLSFLGVQFMDGRSASRVRIVSGNTVLGANETSTLDVVALDDFIYAEPVAIGRNTVPEPATLVLVAGGLAVLVAGRVLRGRRA